jgi:hypothetical protein
MDTSVAAVMVRDVVPEMLPDIAVTVVEPTATAVASPLDPIIATLVLEELQVTAPVKSCVVSSEYVPVAVNCWVVLLEIAGSGGVISMDTSVAVVMVRDVVPEILPDVAVIVVEPAATAVASPLYPAALLMVAAPPDELQVTASVTSCVVPSKYVPVAVNCSVELFAIDGLVGVTAIDDNVV